MWSELFIALLLQYSKFYDSIPGHNEEVIPELVS